MLQGLPAGRVHIAFDNTPQILPHIRASGIRALTVTTRDRSRFAPELPTMIEAGVANFEIASWFRVTAPRNTPQPITDRLGSILQEVVRLPKYGAKQGASQMIRWCDCRLNPNGSVRRAETRTLRQMDGYIPGAMPGTQIG